MRKQRITLVLFAIHHQDAWFTTCRKTRAGLSRLLSSAAACCANFMSIERVDHVDKSCARLRYESRASSYCMAEIDSRKGCNRTTSQAPGTLTNDMCKGVHGLASPGPCEVLRINSVGYPEESVL